MGIRSISDKGSAIKTPPPFYNSIKTNFSFFLLRSGQGVLNSRFYFLIVCREGGKGKEGMGVSFFYLRPPPWGPFTCGKGISLFISSSPHSLRFPFCPGPTIKKAGRRSMERKYTRREGRESGYTYYRTYQNCAHSPLSKKRGKYRDCPAENFQLEKQTNCTSVQMFSDINQAVSAPSVCFPSNFGKLHPSSAV